MSWADMMEDDDSFLTEIETEQKPSPTFYKQTPQLTANTDIDNSHLFNNKISYAKVLTSGNKNRSVQSTVIFSTQSPIRKSQVVTTSATDKMLVLMPDIVNWTIEHIPDARSIGLFLIFFARQSNNAGIKREHDFDAIRLYYSTIKLLTDQNIRFSLWHLWIKEFANKFSHRLEDHCIAGALRTRMDIQSISCDNVLNLYTSAIEKHKSIFGSIRDLEIYSINK